VGQCLSKVGRRLSISWRSGWSDEQNHTRNVT
jgi:hypothetical protein